MTINSTNIIVTGSAGYLGSPMCFNLLSKGYKVIGIDNFCNSDKSSTDTLKRYFKNSYKFYNLDIANNKFDLGNIFIRHRPKYVIHFAALKSVHESKKSPEIYWENNLKCTENILHAMSKSNCNKIIFSSSAAVYGKQGNKPIKENANLQPLSVYAETKIACENIIMKANAIYGIDGISLRYFNPIGFHSSNLFKEKLKNNNHTIVSEIIKSILDKDKILEIYGHDYPTKDGTCERDFIHIDDLLCAHEKLINYIENFKGYDVFNVGFGKAISIKELIYNFIKHDDIILKYKFSKKRDGDIHYSCADIKKISSITGWTAKKTIKDMVIDTLKAYKIPND